MEDDKQLMKYLSWLDDLDQDCIFRDAGNLLTVKMDQDNIAGQSNADNALQYDPNVANFDYSSRMMPYGVNDSVLTGAMSTAQPTVIPDSYNYNNFLPNGGFYTDPALTQTHIPLKPSEQPFCVDVNHTVHSEDSYSNTSGPQLCIDITGNSTNLNISQESNQYTLPNDVDIKDGFFHEEKHLMNDDYTNSQLSMNPISHDSNAPMNNEFSQISSQHELYYGDNTQAVINVDHGTIDEKQFVGVAQNLNEVLKPTTLEPSMKVQDDFQDHIKSQPTTEIKEEFKHEEIDLDSAHEQMTAPVPTESSSGVANNEKPIVQSDEQDHRNISDSVKHPIANGVDKINTEDEPSDVQMCIRNGCTNRAINNPEWEQEFCSNECVIIHCSNVFTSWVKGNEITT